MDIENFDNEQKQNVQELLVLLNLPENDTLNINNTDNLFDYLIKKQKFICINKPKNEYEEVNLFDTIIQVFRKSGEDLPKYFDEPNICDDCEVMKILEMLNSYYNSEEEKVIMILDNARDKYIVCIIPEQQTDKVYTLSFQTGIPLVNIDKF
jgi:hypothetical protein